MSDAPMDAGAASRWLERARARLLRTVKRLVRPTLLKRLRQANEHSTEPVCAASGPVVSLTTYNERLSQVFYTIESIAEGALKPSRLVLWVDQALVDAGLPDSLQRLVRRGLEVRGTMDLGPHTKYFPQVMSEPAPSVPLVTADDDVLYPRYWLQRLLAGWQRDAGDIACFRAHTIALDRDGRPIPYVQWPGCRSLQPHRRHFLTGVSGVVYPVAMQLALRRAGDAFMQSCPRSDDIWLNLVALREGILVRQITPLGRRFFELPGTREQGLARSNVQGGENDRQIAAAYGEQDLKRLA